LCRAFSFPLLHTSLIFFILLQGKHLIILVGAFILNPGDRVRALFLLHDLKIQLVWLSKGRFCQRSQSALLFRGQQLAEEIFVGSHGRLENLEAGGAVKMRAEVLGKRR
jgi:hypothetical protein